MIGGQLKVRLKRQSAATKIAANDMAVVIVVSSVQREIGARGKTVIKSQSDAIIIRVIISSQFSLHDKGELRRAADFPDHILSRLIRSQQRFDSCGDDVIDLALLRFCERIKDIDQPLPL